MKINLINNKVKFFLVFVTIPFSLIKFYLILPLLLPLFFSKRLEKTSLSEYFYLIFFVVAFFGNLVYGKEYNFNPNTPMISQFIICCLVVSWLLIVHFVDFYLFKKIILCYVLTINVSTFGLIAYTYYESPVTLFSRKFLSPFAMGETEFFATPAFGNSSGLLLIASIGFLEKKYQYIAFFSSLFLSFLLQNRTLMIVTVLASFFIFKKSKDKFLFLSLLVMISLLLSFAVPNDLILGSFEVLHERLNKEGLQSERWDLIVVGLLDILSLEHVYGGLDPVEHSLYTYYFHNGILDSYKNFGILGLFVSTSIVLTLLCRLVTNFSPYKILVFFVGVSVFLTSVVFEGMIFEAFTLTLLLSILFRKTYSKVNFN